MGTKDEESQQAPAGLPEPRSRENRTRRARAAKAAPKRLARSFVELPKKANPLVALTVIVVVTVMALTVAQPLRNYFQQKADLAQVNAKPAASGSKSSNALRSWRKSAIDSPSLRVGSASSYTPEYFMAS